MSKFKLFIQRVDDDEYEIHEVSELCYGDCEDLDCDSSLHLYPSKTYDSDCGPDIADSIRRSITYKGLDLEK